MTPFPANYCIDFAPFLNMTRCLCDELLANGLFLQNRRCHRAIFVKKRFSHFLNEISCANALFMRPEKSKRIDLNPEQSGLAGLGNAFAGLNLGSLPVGPEKGQVPEVLTKPTKAKKPGRVVLRKETAHRGGKAVIVVYDFPPAMSEEEIETLAKELRKTIGTGGTVRERTIEVQGEHAPKIRAYLSSQGWQVAGI
jgi:translation initiation factor 1